MRRSYIIVLGALLLVLSACGPQSQEVVVEFGPGFYRAQEDINLYVYPVGVDAWWEGKIFTSQYANLYSLPAGTEFTIKSATKEVVFCPHQFELWNYRDVCTGDIESRGEYRVIKKITKQAEGSVVTEGMLIPAGLIP